MVRGDAGVIWRKDMMNKFMTTIAKWMALLGGAVLVLLIVITCLSVIGRSLNTIGHYDYLEDNVAFIAHFFQYFKPISGDFEIVEAGIAFAILSFFPWCSLNRGHATVDIFTSGLSDSKNRFLAFFWEVIFFAIITLITWRMFVGMSDKMRYGETTLLLQTPVWWGFAVCAFASSVATMVAGYSAYCRFQELRRGFDLTHASGSAGH